MEKFLILGMIVPALDFQEAGKKALQLLQSKKTFKPRLGRKSYFRSKNRVEIIPVENISTGEMDTVQFPQFA
ncbi:MAG: hypothetical protein WCX23_02055 [Candidatus Paceibacterota bacterium]|jgi:hypothetical protein|nr:hypothetical protein [Candidatus Paceibacterota bacterium]MDD4831067.1 hypothetical protein [Candidatus Paceibacterota bacterium]MDD4875468.1 hypothetical protein [Candidatus Paceibacterota bacterium]